ncbi:MAG: tetratricopeptide repeat protein [Chitinispirillaceae bacterium]
MSNGRVKKNPNPSAKVPGTAVAHVPSEDVIKQRRRSLCVAFLLVITTAVVYCNVFRNDFVSYDDGQYVTENPRVRQGMSWENVRWAFTTFYADNWHPLTWLSHMLDVQLFGLKPAGHHFTNLLFHVLATLLLFGFLRYATGRLWAGAFVAALFALHPVHVESVAWVAERKDVLSTVFWFATLWAYAYYAKRPRVGRYAMVIIFFALGLMAKPMLVTLPLVLLLLDYWPLERLEMNGQSVGRLTVEKLPLLIMIAASMIITVIAQQGAIGGFNRLSLGTRLSNAVISYCIYIGQAFWPTGLTVFYPHPQQPFPLEAMAGTLLLIAVTVAALMSGKQKKFLTTGWLWYLITLVPVIGIVQVGNQAHADRYTYVPLIGIFIMISWGLKTIVDRLQNSKKLFVKIAAAALFPAMMGLTWEQVGYWKSDFTLFSHAITVTKRNYVAHNNFGLYLYKTGRTGEAIAHYQKALEIKPNYAEAHNNLGVPLENIGRTDEAIAHYQKALEIKPNYAEAHYNLGNLLSNIGRTDEAIAHYQKALEINPDYAKVHNNLGNLLSNIGRTDEAIAHYRKALEINPDYFEAHNNLGNLLSNIGRIDEAIAHYRKALEINPNCYEVHYNLGNLLVNIGRTDEAIAHYRNALEINPDKINTLQNLADALVRKGQLTDATPILIRALALAKSAGDASLASEIAGNLEMLYRACQGKPR